MFSECLYLAPQSSREYELCIVEIAASISIPEIMTEPLRFDLSELSIVVAANITRLPEVY
jgi:hypothetical protein